MKTVYAYVCGDILHIGHIKHLENAKALGDKLIVGVLTDEAIMEKKPKPIIPFGERVMMVAALRCVDLVVPQETYSPVSNIETLKPDIVMESVSHNKEDIEAIKKKTKNTIVMPYFPDQSSSKIKERIIEEWKENREMIK